MTYQVTEILDETDPPKPHEKHAAKLIAEYFKSDIIFVRKSNFASPDVEIVKTHQIWEIKSPQGDGKRTIQNNFREARGQSDNLIIDLTRTKMENDRAIRRIKSYVKAGPTGFRRIKVIDKAGKVIDIL